MARWSDDKREEVRATLLSEAKRLFEAQGFEQTTIRDIAKASGIATGTLFNYFEDKQALLFEALWRDLEQVKRQCLATLPGLEASLPELFEHIAMSFYGYYAQRPALSRELLKHALLATGAPAARFEAQLDELAQALIGAIGARVERGELDGQVSPPALTLAFFSHYYMVLLMELRRDQPDLNRQRALVRALAEQLVRGVGPRAPHSR